MNIKVMNGILVFCLLSGILLFISTPGFTQTQYNIKEMTPEVQAALEARKARFEQLRALKDQGLMGENNHGYVEALRDDEQAKTLAEAENKDRKFIYKTIEQQNNLTDAMATIEKVFAQVQQDKAITGDKIQQENGQWVTKD